MSKKYYHPITNEKISKSKYYKLKKSNPDLFKSTPDSGKDEGSEITNSGKDKGSETPDSGKDEGSETPDSGKDEGSEITDSGKDKGSETTDFGNDQSSGTTEPGNDESEEDDFDFTSKDRKPTGKSVKIRIWSNSSGTRRFNDPDLPHLIGKKKNYFAVPKSTPEGFLLPFPIPDEYAQEVSRDEKRNETKVLLVPRIIENCVIAGMTVKIDGVS